MPLSLLINSEIVKCKINDSQNLHITSFGEQGFKSNTRHYNIPTDHK